MINDLESSRFISCSFFPYSLNEDSDIVLLMRQKVASNPIYFDFGTTFKESDPSIFHSAARSYLKKSLGLCIPDEIPFLETQSEIMRILRENSQKNTIELFDNNKIQIVLKTLTKNNAHVVIDVVCENHLAIFFPLPYFDLKVINATLKTTLETLPNLNKYSDMQFRWVSLNEIGNPKFCEEHISSFDYQIICSNVQKLSANLIGDQSKDPDYHGPDYAVMICDDLIHLDNVNETLMMA